MYAISGFFQLKSRERRNVCHIWGYLGYIYNNTLSLSTFHFFLTIILRYKSIRISQPWNSFFWCSPGRTMATDCYFEYSDDFCQFLLLTRRPRLFSITPQTNNFLLHRFIPPSHNSLPSNRWFPSHLCNIRASGMSGDVSRGEKSGTF